MGIPTAWLIISFLAVSSSRELTSSPSPSTQSSAPEQTSSSTPSDRSAALEISERADNDLVPESEVSIHELTFLESTIKEERKVSEVPSAAAAEVELPPNVRKSSHHPDASADDSSAEAGQRGSKRVRDSVPFLQLTQGGYRKPDFRQFTFRRREVPNPEGSEQVEKSQTSNNNEPTRRVVPSVTYSIPGQVPLGFVSGPGSGFPVNRNVLSINHVIPGTVPNIGPTDFARSAFQQPNNDVGVFTNILRDSGGAPLYQQSAQGDPRVALQGVENHPYIVDTSRNAVPLFYQGNFNAYPGFEDNSGPRYPSYFGSGPLNPPFQVPPNFFGGNANNGFGPFGNPPMQFVPNYPSPDNRFPPQIPRNTPRNDARNRQANDDPRPETDASQEIKNSETKDRKIGEEKNRKVDGPAPFGTRIQRQNERDVYMRYPTDEAGYAVEESLPPPRNNSSGPRVNQQFSRQDANFPNGDPYRNALAALRSDSSRNGSQPDGLLPLEFGYQASRVPIFGQYSSETVSLYPDFDSGQIAPESDYQFPSVEVQQRRRNLVPACARQTNATICFEDNEYPRDDIAFAMNSNSYITDRLAGFNVRPDSVVLVEWRNDDSNATREESSVCASDVQTGTPLRAMNARGEWTVVVYLEERFVQPVRMEVCRSLGDACSYTNDKVKTSCVQKYSLQRLLSWTPDIGIFSDLYRLPVACSCHILGEPTA